MFSTADSHYYQNYHINTQKRLHIMPFLEKKYIIKRLMKK